MELNEALLKLGLSPKEAKVYLTLLKGGQMSGSKVGEKTNFHRRTAYDLLNSLSERGLVTSIIRERITYFEATDPRIFLDYVKEQEEAINSVLPELELLKNNSKDDTDVQIYHGTKSIKKIFDDILRHKSYEVLGAGEPLRKLLGPFFMLFQKKKEGLKIKSRILISEEYVNDEVVTKTRGEIRLLSQYESPITTYIYGDKVAIILSNPALGILIEDKNVSKSFSSYFNLLWNIATPLRN